MTNSILSADASSSLHQASEQGDLTGIRAALKKGANLEAEFSSYTPLMIASREGHPAAAELLLEKGAGVDNPNTFGETPLYVAAFSCRDSVIRVLLRYGADVNRSNDSGRTPLMSACFLGHPTTVRLLLEAGADSGLRDKYGDTALDIAQKFKNQNVVKVLNGWNNS